MMSYRLASACLLTVAACGAEPEAQPQLDAPPAPDPDPTLTARFSTATHDQLGISLYAAADLVNVNLYRNLVRMASGLTPGCVPTGTPGDALFTQCVLEGSARAQNSSLTWPRQGALADVTRPETITATGLLLSIKGYDGQVVRSSPASAIELGSEVDVEVTMRFEHPWANSDSVLQVTELPDGPGLHYVIADTSRISVDGVGRAAVSGDIRLTQGVSAEFAIDGWLELRGAETLRATLRAAEEECTPLTIDGAAVDPLCHW
jgi:hypothetical protein